MAKGSFKPKFEFATGKEEAANYSWTPHSSDGYKFIQNLQKKYSDGQALASRITKRTCRELQGRLSELLAAITTTSLVAFQTSFCGLTLSSRHGNIMIRLISPDS